jgi:hypothetical protein
VDESGMPSPGNIDQNALKSLPKHEIPVTIAGPQMSPCMVGARLILKP